MPIAIPSILTSYVSPAAPGSLTLITPVLDATSNWLVLRFVHAALNGQETATKHGQGGVPPAEEPAIGSREKFKVIFVSWLRGFRQWKEMGKKVGLDFSSLVSGNQLVYLDGLCTSLPLPPSKSPNPEVVVLQSHDLQELEIAIHQHIGQIFERDHTTTQSRVVLILDGLDYLLASQPLATNLNLSRSLLNLRQQVSNTIVTCSADSPLLHNSSAAATPLELEHRAFLTSLAHQSRMVIQLRSLRTGVAKDISGILRVSAGGAHDALDEGEDGVEGGEWLYQVKADGSVRSWSRGE